MNFMKAIKLGFSQKLLFSMLVIGLGPLLLTSWLLTTTSNEGLEQQVFAQLDSVREIRRKQIEDYFSTIDAQIITMAENKMVIEAAAAFTSSFAELKPSDENKGVRESVRGYYQDHFASTYKQQTETSPDINRLLPASDNATFAQYLYMSNNKNPLGSKHQLDAANDGSHYSSVHAEYHPIFRHFLEKFGYYDIFLVDMQQGDVVYSVFKEIDYATSLKNGPHKNSGLGKAYKASVDTKPGSTHILDFKPYLPSYEAAASFISSPIYNGDKQTGVLIFQMPVDRINAITLDSTGLGESGETYLVGDDQLMRSQSRFSDTATLGVLKIDTEGSRSAVAGKSGQKMLTDYRGIDVLSSYAPLHIDGLNWAILSEIDKSEAFATSIRLLHQSSIMAGVSIIAVFAIAWLVIRSTMHQLGASPEQLGKVAKAIAEDQLDIEFNKNDMVGVYRRMSDMRDKLQARILSERKSAAENTQIKTAVDNATNNILYANRELEITYSNESYLRFIKGSLAEFRKAVPSFSPDGMLGTRIDNYHVEPDAFREQLLNLTETRNFDTQFGDLHIRITATPVFNDTRQRIGTVTEWSDRTQQIHTEVEIQDTVNQALSGNLGLRISTANKQSFFLRLSNDVNKLMDVCDHAITDAVEAVVALSKGNLTHTIDNSYSGSFHELKDGINKTGEKLTEIMAEISLSAEMVRNSSKDIAGGNLDLSNRTESQAANLEEAASSMEEMTAAVMQNSDNLIRANSLASDTQKQAIEGGNVVSDTVLAMADITDSSNKISEIIGVIDEIAFQTNLLALNASVEAARAGTSGRGFAVVADEVRNLAGRSSGAAKEIKTLIQDSVVKVKQGTHLADQSGMSLKSIVESINELSSVIAEISNASQDQSDGIKQVNLSVGQMDEVTQQNVALVEEAAAAADILSTQASSLKNLINFFEISNDGGHGNSARTSAGASSTGDERFDPDSWVA